MNVLSPAMVWLPLVLTTVASTVTLLGLAIMPSPPTTLSVTVPLDPPPVKPAPASTPVISAVLSLAMVIVPPVFVTVMFVPPWNTTVSLLVTDSCAPAPESVLKFQLPKLSAVVVNAPVPLLYDSSPLALKCDLTSLALGPVYVNTPVVLLYENEPSPPVSVALKAPLIAVMSPSTVSTFALSVIVVYTPSLNDLMP